MTPLPIENADACASHKEHRPFCHFMLRLFPSSFQVTERPPSENMIPTSNENARCICKPNTIKPSTSSRMLSYLSSISPLTPKRRTTISLHTLCS